MINLTTAYATQLTPVLQDAVTALFGKGAVVAGQPGCDPTGPDAVWPFSADTHEVIGFAMVHRSGPRFTVARKRAS